MTNFEYLLENENELIKRILLGSRIAKENGEPELCEHVCCEDCDWCDECEEWNNDFVKNWLDEEYNPYSDWEIDEKVEVKFKNPEFKYLEWKKAYFAGINENGEPMVWYGGKTSWTCDDNEKLRVVAYVARKVESNDN